MDDVTLEDIPEYPTTRTPWIVIGGVGGRIGEPLATNPKTKKARLTMKKKARKLTHNGWGWVRKTDNYLYPSMMATELEAKSVAHSGVTVVHATMTAELPATKKARK